MSNLVVRTLIAAAVVLSPVASAVALPAGTRPIPQVAMPVPQMKALAIPPSPMPVPQMNALAIPPSPKPVPTAYIAL